jgi:hypothetical protein
MELPKLYDVPAVQARYGCSRQMASKIIRSGAHITSPRLMVPEWALMQWEQQQMGPSKVMKNSMIARRMA